MRDKYSIPPARYDGVSTKRRFSRLETENPGEDHLVYAAKGTGSVWPQSTAEEDNLGYVTRSVYFLRGDCVIFEIGKNRDRVGVRGLVNRLCENLEIHFDPGAHDTRSRWRRGSNQIKPGSYRRNLKSYQREGAGRFECRRSRLTITWKRVSEDKTIR